MSILSTLIQYLLFWHKKLPKSYFQEEKALFFTSTGIKKTSISYSDNWHKKTLNTAATLVI